MANHDKTPDTPPGQDASPAADTAHEPATAENPTPPDTEATAEPADAAAPAASARGRKQKRPARSRRPGKLAIWLIALLFALLLAAGAGLYWGWTTWQNERTAMDRQQASLSSDIQQLQQQVRELASARSEQNQATRATRNRLNTAEQRLIELAQQLNQARTVQSSDLERLEIEYLLRNARHVSLLNQDVGRTIQLLEQADAQLAAMDDLAYLPVREALAIDLQRLRELPQPDVDGLYFELKALSERATAWNWWPQTAPDPDRAEDADKAATTRGLSGWLQGAWREVRNLVTVRYRTHTDAMRLAPDTFQQMQVRFQLFLQQAQVALIQRNETLFQTSLEQARSWLQQGAEQVPESAWLLTRLEQLADTPVALELPQVDRALKALQELDAASDQSSETTAAEDTE